MTCKVRDLGSPAESVSYEDAPARLHAPVGLTLDAAGIETVGGTAEIAQASPEITATGSLPVAPLQPAEAVPGPRLPLLAIEAHCHVADERTSPDEPPRRL